MKRPSARRAPPPSNTAALDARLRAIVDSVKEPKPKPAPLPVPTIGRIVHCYGEDAAGGLTGPYAAIVVRRSHGLRLGLAVFTGATTRKGRPETEDWICSFSEEPKRSCWSWPPRVP